MTAQGGLVGWAERSALRRAGSLTTGGSVPGRLRFVFYGRVSTEDWQDPVTSRARQREQAEALVRGHGVIVAELFDVGESRTVAWARRPLAAALVAQLADPDRGWDAIVIGEYERAFYGSQYAAMAPLFEHYGAQLWMPETGGRVDYQCEHDEKTMTVLGLSSKREITRTSIRVRTAMAAQTREQGRYLGGRPPYGYRLADAGPHPNKAHAAWGRRAYRLEPDPAAAHRGAVDLRPAPGRAFGRADRAGAERGRGTVPVRGRPRPQQAPDRSGMDAGHSHHHLAEPPVHRPAGVEPAAHRHRAGRPGQRHPRAQERAAVEPARRLGDIEPSRASRAGQRSRLHRRPGHQRRPGPGPAARTGAAPLPAGRAARLRHVRAADGISLVQRQGRVPLPPRPYQRDGAGPGPAEEHLRARGQAACRTCPPCTSCSPPPRCAPGAGPAPEPMSGIPRARAR